MVLRLRELAVQMANGIYQDNPDRAFAQIEVDQLIQQIDLIAETANFNGVKLLDGTMQNVGSRLAQPWTSAQAFFSKIMLHPVLALKLSPLPHRPTAPLHW